jgi:hypothetical protein
MHENYKHTPSTLCVRIEDFTANRCTKIISGGKQCQCWTKIQRFRDHHENPKKTKRGIYKKKKKKEIKWQEEHKVKQRSERTQSNGWPHSLTPSSYCTIHQQEEASVYEYQRRTAIQHIDFDDGDRGDLRNVEFWWKIDMANRPRKFQHIYPLWHKIPL